MEFADVTFTVYDLGGHVQGTLLNLFSCKFLLSCIFICCVVAISFISNASKFFILIQSCLCLYIPKTKFTIHKTASRWLFCLCSLGRFIFNAIRLEG